jgi:sugar/nucleoside kinase (ribokinase family)
MTIVWSAFDRSTIKPVRITTLGTVSWDELLLIDSWPDEAGFSYVRSTESTPGGTTGNCTMTIRRLGAEVELFSVVGCDGPGLRILEDYRGAGVGVDHVSVVEGATDVSYVLVSSDTSERTILWKQGPYLKRGDRIDVDRLFHADVVVLDPVDFSLRSFLTDLPAHTRPRARVLGPLSYLCEDTSGLAPEVALRHDVVVGSEREYTLIFGIDDPDSALAEVQHRMVGANCRLAIMTRGQRGSSAVDQVHRWDCPAAPADVVDTTGAGDAFAGAVAFGMAQHWDPPTMLSFASAVSAAAIEQFGAQIGLPSLDEVLNRLARLS